MRKILSTVLVFANIFLFAQRAFAFSDVQKDSLTYMYAHGIIDGYSDGTFLPKNTIKRAGLVKMIMDASHKTPDSEKKNCFPDVDDREWYAPYVCAAKANGWIQGYEDGTFRPAQKINKVETLKIIAAIQNWPASRECMKDPKIPYKDVVQCSWYYNFVVSAEDESYVDSGTYFKPSAEITRGDVAEILFRTLVREKLGRIDKPQENAKNALAAKVRDFFAIEKKASSVTYDQNTIEEIDGNIYGVSQISFSGLEIVHTKGDLVTVRTGNSSPDPGYSSYGKEVDIFLENRR